MGEYVPKFNPGQAVTYTASAAVTGGQLVEVTGDRSVAPATANSTKTAGVAGFDAKAGESVTVYSGGGHRLKAAGAIAAGDTVSAAAGGAVAKDGTAPVGLALSSAPDGNLADVALDR